MENHVEKLKELVGKCRVGMLGTQHDDTFQFRPMSHVDIDDEGKIWFFVSLEAENAEQVRDSPKVSLTYANENENMYLSIDGLAFLNTEYWVSNEGKIMTYFKMLSAAMVGTTPSGSEHKKITL
jgi:general stress protein 26